MQLICPCRRTSSVNALNYIDPAPQYSDCCKPLHTRSVRAKSAEQLMRSRYSAYVLHLADYLLETHHPDFRQANVTYQREKESLKKSFDNTEWLGLIVHRHHKSNHLNDKAKQAQVEFSAFFIELSGKQKDFKQIHERSSFLLNSDQWYYTDGEFLPDYKLKKNEACFCASGKKFKRCHGV